MSATNLMHTCLVPCAYTYLGLNFGFWGHILGFLGHWASHDTGHFGTYVVHHHWVQEPQEQSITKSGVYKLDNLKVVHPRFGWLMFNWLSEPWVG